MSGTASNKKKLTRKEAEQAVRDMVDRGAKYREVSQVEFNIDGRTKRFRISDISAIVNG